MDPETEQTDWPRRWILEEGGLRSEVDPGGRQTEIRSGFRRQADSEEKWIQGAGRMR